MDDRQLLEDLEAFLWHNQDRLDGSGLDVHEVLQALRRAASYDLRGKLEEAEEELEDLRWRIRNLASDLSAF